MRTQTDLKIVLSLSEMKAIIEIIERNKHTEPAMSDNVIFSLCHDSDFNALSIDENKAGRQFSGYSECNSMVVKI